MIKLEEQVVSLELAKRLKELGVPQVGLYAWDTSQEPHKLRKGGIVRNPGFKAVTAFTVAELGEILKMLSKDENGAWTEWNYVWSNWQCYLQDRNCESVWSTDATTEADARALMLVYVIENKLLQP